MSVCLSSEVTPTCSLLTSRKKTLENWYSQRRIKCWKLIDMGRSVELFAGIRCLFRVLTNSKAVFFAPHSPFHFLFFFIFISFTERLRVAPLDKVLFVCLAYVKKSSEGKEGAEKSFDQNLLASRKTLFCLLSHWVCYLGGFFFFSSFFFVLKKKKEKNLAPNFSFLWKEKKEFFMVWFSSMSPIHKKNNLLVDSI